MSDISNQLIKDSYDYVLQSDLSTGVVYRIGGGIPVNPTFLSGITINSTFTFADGSQQNGYVLTSDASGNASWKPVSGTTPSSGVTSITVGNGLSANSSTGAVTIVFTGSTGISGEYLPLSGGTVTGDTIFQSGLTATTISATTYYNLPINPDSFVTGFSLNNNIITLSQNRVDLYSAFTISLSAYTGSSITTGAYLPLSGGTVTGDTIFQSGLTATTVSATTYYNLPVSAVTSGAGISASTTNGSVTIINTAPDQTVTITGGTNIEILGSYPNFGVNYTGQTSFPYLALSGGTVTGDTIFNSGLTATTISAATYLNVNAVTGGSYSNGTITLSGTGNVNGNTITGFTKYFISASTPTGFTIYNGDRWYNTNNGIELVYIDDGNSSQWVQPSNTPGPPGYSNLMITTGITTSAATLDININYYGVNYNGQVNLTLPNPSGYDGYNFTIKDEGGYAATHRIRLTSISGLIDGNNYVDINLRYVALHLMARNNNWWII
jgi:hypothetical protein